ncbi:MAG: hypothetical protein HFI69_04315 [Lachnospiraceae bacterium]|nr:hypothetical protein [Lachnospiraceae bacterium]
MFKIKGHAAELSGIFAGGVLASVLCRKLQKRENIRINKYKKNFLILNEWISLKQKGLSVLDYFSVHNYKRILLTGNGVLADRFYKELSENGYQIIRRNNIIHKQINPELADVMVMEEEECQTSQIPAVTIESIICGREE